MKVLFITGEYPPMQGGVGDYTREIGRALAALGVEVHVATSARGNRGDGAPAGRAAAGVTVHAAVERWSWGCWRTLLELVRQERPDVVHVQYQAAAYGLHPAINLWPQRLRVLGGGRPRTVVTFHDLKVPYLFPKAGPLRKWAVYELARRSDGAVTTNRPDFEELVRALGAEPALIPIGSNIQAQPPAGYDRSAWRARWGAGPDDLVVCHFGFVNERKGVDTLLRAVARLAADPEAARVVRLVMIGGRTGSSDPTNVAYLARIEALIGELGLGERVVWTGFLPPEEVSACFLAADLCALPFRDGASLLHGTLHAALAHGAAVVTTQPGVEVAELAHGETAYLVPTEDTEALAGAMRRLAVDGALRARLGAGARALAEQFGWDRIAAETLALYGRLGVEG